MWRASGTEIIDMVIDTCTFFNELELLEIRLNELDPVVDAFVIVEATQTHQGRPKPLYFQENKHLFEKFLPKIRHSVVEFPENLPLEIARDQEQYPANWARERLQRNKIKEQLLNCKPTDIIIISDLDEIPSAEAVAKYKPEMGICFFEMGSFYYFFNTKVGTWTHAKIMPWGDLINRTPSFVRNKEAGNSMEFFGGWHYSYMGGADRILKKYQSFAHQEYNPEGHQTVGGIEKMLEEGMNINSGNPFNYEFYHHYPKFVIDNMDRFKKEGFFFPE